MNIIRQIKCWFGVHSYESIPIFKSDKIVTTNYYCPCGDSYGSTHFGPFNFKIDPNDEPNSLQKGGESLKKG